MEIDWGVRLAGIRRKLHMYAVTLLSAWFSFSPFKNLRCKWHELGFVTFERERQREQASWTFEGDGRIWWGVSEKRCSSLTTNSFEAKENKRKMIKMQLWLQWLQINIPHGTIQNEVFILWRCQITWRDIGWFVSVTFWPCWDVSRQLPTGLMSYCPNLSTACRSHIYKSDFEIFCSNCFVSLSMNHGPEGKWRISLLVSRHEGSIWWNTTRIRWRGDVFFAFAPDHRE